MPTKRDVYKIPVFLGEDGWTRSLETNFLSMMDNCRKAGFTIEALPLSSHKLGNGKSCFVGTMYTNMLRSLRKGITQERLETLHNFGQNIDAPCTVKKGTCLDRTESFKAFLPNSDLWATLRAPIEVDIRSIFGGYNEKQ